MGRDVQYSPFTWQNQSTAHNRFLKFLLVIILLSLLSFYIGYPDQSVDAPKPESRPYNVQEAPRVRYSEPQITDVEPSTEDVQEVTSTEATPEESSEFTTTSSVSSNEFENSSFNESVVPSGPNPFSSLMNEEKLKALEEGERRIIESQEDLGKEEVEKSESRNVAADIGITGGPGEISGKLGQQDDEKTPEGQNENGEGSEVTSTQASTEEQNVQEQGSESTSSETPKVENVDGTTSTQSLDEASNDQETVKEEATTTDSSSTTSSINEEVEQEVESTTESSTDKTEFPKEMRMEDAEKQIEEVSANLTVVEGGEKFEEESTTVSIVNEERNITETSIETSTNATEASDQQDQEKKNKMFENLSECHVEDWNNVTLDEVPHQTVFKQWLAQNGNPGNNETNSTPKVLGAFAYKNYIAVTLSERNFSSETVYCRYYDCHKKQLVRQMPSFVFPESTVYCPRRAGARFISISTSIEDKGQYPVQILKRLVPQHFFTVCVSMNNHEENILKIARFIEYYKLQGSTFFHVYLKNSSHYQRMLLDEYVRTGDVKVIKIGENATEQVQASDCQHRSKYFSKWTSFLNLEDQLEMKEDSETISAFLDSITEHKTNILKWNSLESENITRLLIRPERVVSINYHPIQVYSGDQLRDEDEPSGALKQFSTTHELTPENFSMNIPEGTPFRDEIIENVLSRTKYVFSTIESDLQKEREATSAIEKPTETPNIDLE